MNNDYTHFLQKNKQGCPYLFLAPMEGVGDRPFRQAMAKLGGFDEACTEFIRVPINAHVESLSRVYESSELGSIPLAAQIMGSDPELVAQMALALQKRGAPRIDLNCGCPSNTVTGKGAGSSLLKDPTNLYKVAKSIKQSIDIPFTIKMRSGYDDTSLFLENLLAAEASGASFITLHARTKKQGYSDFADRELIKKAKEVLSIPLVGNGDITTVESALHMLKFTGCDALMIGRGAVMDPFIFRKIKAHFKSTTYENTLEEYLDFLDYFSKKLNPATPEKTRVNKIKQILSFRLKSSQDFVGLKTLIMQLQSPDCPSFLDSVQSILYKELKSDAKLLFGV